MEIFGVPLERILERGAILFGLLTARYLIFAGIAFWLVWIVFARRTAPLRIQPSAPPARRIRAEFGWSMATMVIFALVGLGLFIAKQNGFTKIYLQVSEHGVPYLIASTIGLIIFHDFYFYVTHRIMHMKGIFKYVHHVHHRSTNPSPWASFAFHPYEAVIEAAVVPIAVFFVPMHPFAVLAFLVYMTALNVLGHLGFELFPKGFASNPWTRWHNTTVHHNLHHEKVHCNYSLYFNFWDRIFGTMYDKYESTYDAVKAGHRSGLVPLPVQPNVATVETDGAERYAQVAPTGQVSAVSR